MGRSIYKQLLDNLSTAVLMLDGRRCLRYLNPAAEMLFEVSATRMMGESVFTLIRDHSEFQEVLLEAWESGHPYAKREAQLMLHSGRELATDYWVTPLQAEDAGLMLVEVQPRDRLVRIGREEEARNQRETTRGLIRGLAHEIKNPLGGIRGAAQLLDRALPDDALADYTRVIIEEADRLKNLVDRMLGPRRMPNMQRINVHQILERIFSLVSAEAGHEVEILRDYDPSIPELEADEEQLIQAVLNVVRNGVQALVEGETKSPRMTLRTRAVRQFTLGAERHRLVCQIGIIDNGPGIPEKIQETLFYPMISGRAEGTGLGLSIAQAIIHQHQGLVEFYSEPGHTEFLIYIPLEQKHENNE